MLLLQPEESAVTAVLHLACQPLQPDSVSVLEVNSAMVGKGWQLRKLHQ